jgi:Flp pilus assembly pilin Flp
VSVPAWGRVVLAWLWSRAEGQGIVEYGVILALTALVTIVALVFFGGALATALSLIGQAIDSSTT